MTEGHFRVGTLKPALNPAKVVSFAGEYADQIG